MARGFMGRILNVDLSAGKLSDEPTDETLCRSFVGGYGLGAKLLFDRMDAGVDPLGPDNLLGFLTGPLTGSPSIEGNRFVVVCKSPLTLTWGDANCGGTFGPHLKFAGYDGVVFSGASDTPVYLWIKDGKAELRDASQLWGKDTNETEDVLIDAHGGKGVEVASIGPAGENLSLLSGIINDKGRAAGRSGVGAVMGSKKLKAIAVSGDQEVPVHDMDKAQALRKEYMQRHGGFYDILKQYGTVGITADSAMSGDSPVKNWGGVGPVDFPTGAEKFMNDTVIAYQDKKYGCWRCTMTCGGHMSVKDGDYAGTSHHKVEYETAAAWGTMTLMDKFPALIKINELCNKLGFDTIGAGCTAAFAVECYENGILTKGDTDGLELNWGNDKALVDLVSKMAHREGVGDLLADGTWRASQKLGKGSEEFAIHVQGSEVPMHDPKFQPGLATTYKMDATPARHTQGHEDMPPMIDGWPEHDKYEYSGKGELHRKCMAQIHVVNSAGVCMFAYLAYDWEFIPDFLSAVTGWDIDTEECYTLGERIADIRHAFNLREGLNPIEFVVPKRLLGEPPQTEGNVRGVTVDIDTQVKDFCAAMDWDPKTAVPSKGRLKALGLDEVAAALHG
ncbi:aldehyde ferredoxin oxidoreductase family protein [Candidatus Latescibacterota bacterium]